MQLTTKELTDDYTAVAAALAKEFAETGSPIVMLSGVILKPDSIFSNQRFIKTSLEFWNRVSLI